MTFDKITDRYAVLVYRNGELMADRTKTSSSLYHARVDLEDALKSLIVPSITMLRCGGLPIHNEKIVLYDLDFDQIIYSASAEWTDEGVSE